MADLKSREEYILNFVKGLNKDSSKLNVSAAEYIDAKNIVDSHEDGDMLTITNEKGFEVIHSPAEKLGDGYVVIGHCPLSGIDKNNRTFNWEILFLVQPSTGNSEVGIFDYDSDTYVTKVNDGNVDQDIDANILVTVTNTGTSLLTFSVNYQIDATARQIFNLNRVVYFTDGLNPPRRIDLDQEDNFTDINQQTQLFQNLKLPVCEYVEQNDSGNVRVGVYQFVARYLSNDLTPTTFGIPCNVIPVVEDLSTSPWYEYDGANFDLDIGQKSIIFDVKHIDTNYDYIEVAVIYYEGSQSSLKAKIFSRQAIGDREEIRITFDGTFPDDAQEILLEDIVQRPISYKTAKHVIQKDNRLLFSNLKTSPIDYELQKIANNIKVYYEITELPHNQLIETPDVKVGYRDEYNTYAYKGYQRGEVYSLAFGVIFKDGSLSAAYPIPGGNDHPDYAALEALLGSGEAGYLSANTGTQRVGTYISGETTNIYDGTTVELIRHHYMPTLEQEPHFTDGGTAIRVLGLRFDDIDFGQVSDPDVRELLKNDIQGVYFAKEDRDTSNKKSIIAQGVFNRHMTGVKTSAGGNPSNVIQINPLTGDTMIIDDGQASDLMAAYTVDDLGDPTLIIIYDNLRVADTPSLGPVGRDAQIYTQTKYAGFWSPDTILIPNNSDVNLADDFTPELLVTSQQFNSAPSYNNLATLYEDSTDSQTVAGSMYFFNYTTLPSLPDEITYKPYYSLTEDSQKRTIESVEYINYPNRDDLWVNPSDAAHTSTYPALDTSAISGFQGEDSRLFNKGNEGYLLVALSQDYEQASNPLTYFQEDAEMKLLGNTVIYNAAAPVRTNSNSVFYYDAVLNDATGGTPGYSHELIFDSGESGSQDNFKSIQNSNHTRFICNLRQRLNNQYGNLDSTEYSIIEDYYFDLNEIEFNGDLLETSTTSYLVAYKGDTFVSKFSYRNRTTIPSFLVLPNYSYHGMRGFHLVSVNSFFVESTINAEYRHRIQNDDGTSGPPYWPNNPTPPSVNPETGSTTGTDPDNVWTYNPAAGNANGYNIQYSKENDIKTVNTVGLNFEFVTYYPTRTIYSQFSNEGEQSDRYKIFLPNDYYDLPKHSGEITNQFIWNGQLFLHTENSIWQTFFNSISAVASSLGEVYLGTGKAFSQPAQQLQAIDGGYAGCQHKWSSVTTPFGYYFVDFRQKKVFLLTDSLKEISYEGKMSKWFEENLWFEDNPLPYTNPNYNPNFHNNPANPNGCGIVSVYDFRNRRILTTIQNENTDSGRFRTFSYSLNSLGFRSFHDYKMTMPFTNGVRTISVCNYEDSVKFYEHGLGNYGQYYSLISGNPPYPWYITFIINKYPDTTKTFGTLDMVMKVEDLEEDKELFNKFFDSIQCWNDFQNTGEIDLILQYPESVNEEINNVRYVNREFRLTIPRDIVIDKKDNIFDNVNLYTDPLPDFLPRMKGKYLVVKLIGNNEIDTSVSPNRNYRMNVQYIRSKFRLNNR